MAGAAERKKRMLIAQRPTLTEEVVDDYRSRFVLEPLEPGFGYTLGNSLRRTLLSSIPGASVTSVKIDGVLHEFSTIPGVKEDVTEVVLNLKELVVSSEHDEPVTMYLRKQGPGEVTAADIAPPAVVERLGTTHPLRLVAFVAPPTEKVGQVGRFAGKRLIEHSHEVFIPASNGPPRLGEIVVPILL
jgi:hypothetical protein